MIRKIINKHNKSILIILFLLIISLLTAQYDMGFLSNFAYSLIGALIGTLFVFGLIETSMQIEKEKRWQKCKDYTLYILSTSSAKFVGNFVDLEELKEITPEAVKTQEKWFIKILKDSTFQELQNYLKTLKSDYWYDYDKELVQNYNTKQLEKILDKLINLDIDDKELIDSLVTFLLNKEKLKYLIGFADYSGISEPDDHKDAIESMLKASIKIHNLIPVRS